MKQGKGGVRLFGQLPPSGGSESDIYFVSQSMHNKTLGSRPSCHDLPPQTIVPPRPIQRLFNMPATSSNVHFEQAVINSAEDTIKEILTGRLLRPALSGNTTLPKLWDAAVSDMREQLVSADVLSSGQRN